MAVVGGSCAGFGRGVGAFVVRGAGGAGAVGAFVEGRAGATGSGADLGGVDGLGAPRTIPEAGGRVLGALTLRAGGAGGSSTWRRLCRRRLGSWDWSPACCS